MKSTLCKGLLPVLALFVAAPSGASSFYPLRPEDSRALYLAPNDASHGEVPPDATDQIQSAINKIQETSGQGILFIPEGRYRISRTLIVWPGIRLMGYGSHRPVLVLAKNTPGYESEIGYMVLFAGGRPLSAGAAGGSGVAGIVPPDASIPDANPGTFYSAMSNIDLDIENGNPGAVGIRFHVAQHSYLAHMDFHIGSGLAALHDIGNEAEDLHFFGGRYGILTAKPSPGWQFTLLDSSFEGQREAAIREHEAGLTVIRARFTDVPTAISIDPGYADELWVKDATFEGIRDAAVVISYADNARTEINLENVNCRHVPRFALLRDSGRRFDAPAETYHVSAFTHGLSVASTGAEPRIETRYAALPLRALPPSPASDIPAPPAQSSWVNLRELGAKGDGISDDTAILQKAIAEHRTLYLPSGRYVVTDTITLRPDTVLIGLHPSTTQLTLPDATPAFQGPGTPKALLETPTGGRNIVSGLGIYTNGINSRAVGVKWMAGSESLMDDVRLLGGHGTNAPGVTWNTIYNNTHSADSDAKRRWDSQYPSLWIEGGGGTFANIWTPSTFAQAGVRISDTSTPGRIYELSSEHHVRNEAQLDHVSHWQIYALQTEEERGESAFALPLSIANSSDITVANYHAYRVVSSSQPAETAIKISHSNDIRLRNVHVFSDSKVSFDNAALIDATPVRNREFASLTVGGAPTVAQRHAPSAVLTDGSMRKLRDGFHSLAGAAVDAAGQLYFIDSHWQRIYRWKPSTNDLEIVSDSPLAPTQLVFDRSGHLLVISSEGDGTVYALSPGAPAKEATFLKAEPAVARPAMTAWLPINYWRNEHDFAQAILKAKPYQFVSPDRSVYIPAGEDFVSGALYYGAKTADVIRAFSLAPASAGRPFYISDESEQRTYRASVAPDGSLTHVELFAEQGGESVAQDAAGNVYIAAGQILVFDASGHAIDTLKVPERPIDLKFGGQDGKTLYILSHHALYSVRTRFAGRH
jgi:sugar lactone lactonase YvrE